MSLTRMSTNEYAEKRNILPSTVRKAVKFGHALPGVEYHQIEGRDRFFYVDMKKLNKFLAGNAKVT